MKILVISAEVWRDDTNGGNVLSNLFSGIDAEFAQIYCNPGKPKNNICKKYYQITDKMVIDSYLKRKPIGNVISFDEFPIYDEVNEYIDTVDIKKNNFLKMLKCNSLLAIREIMWNCSNWKNYKLEQFIRDFNPDIVFAPCYGSHIMLSINRYVANITNVPVISYISDDHYSLKQFSISPIYWINRFILRNNLRKTFPYYSLIYTMTQEQLQECKKAFNCNIKILKKGGEFKEDNLVDKEVNKRIKLVYAGGIYLGRWKTLAKIAKAIKKLNKYEDKFVLDIYTGNELTKKQNKYLNDGQNSRVHGLVSQEKLREIYKEADIALHVEGFNLKDRLATRISFSTKIIDLLGSSCAVMAISWKKHSGYTYLKSQDAAICIDNLRDIEGVLSNLYSNKQIIREYSKKAWRCGKKNHGISNIKLSIQEDFKELTTKK